MGEGIFLGLILERKKAKPSPRNITVLLRNSSELKYPYLLKNGLLPGSGSVLKINLYPDPYWKKYLDPDPYKTYTDPKHRYQKIYKTPHGLGRYFLK